MREAIIIGTILGLFFFMATAAMTAIAVKYATPSVLWDVIFWGGIAGMIMSVATLALFVSSQMSGRPFVIPSALIDLGICLAVAGFVWHFSSSHQKAAEYLYFRVDILNPNNMRAISPGVIVNADDVPYQAVDSWFSPSAAGRNPDLAGGPYWSLRPLKVSMQLLHKGEFRTGKEIPPGDYCVEYNAVRLGLSIGFLERLQILPVNGKLVQVIDVWKNGELVYSSARPEGFNDTPVPWPH